MCVCGGIRNVFVLVQVAIAAVVVAEGRKAIICQPLLPAPPQPGSRSPSAAAANENIVNQGDVAVSAVSAPAAFPASVAG